MKKILVYVLSYAIAFALAFYAIYSFNGESTPVQVWIIFAFFAIAGLASTKSSESSYFIGGEIGESFFFNTLFFVLRIILSAIAGVFVAPYKIAKNLTSLMKD